MHLNKEIKQNCSILSLGNAPRTLLSAETCSEPPWGSTWREIICSISITRRETAVKQVLTSHLGFGLLTLIPPPRFRLARAVNSTKRRRAMPDFEGYGIAQKTFPHSYFLPCEQHQEGPTLALLCCSFQTNGLSQDNQMRMTSGYQTSAKALLFWSWQEGDVLQMPASL